MKNIIEYINNPINLSINNEPINIYNENLNINEEKIDINKVEPMQIPSADILKKVVDSSNPKAPSKDKGGEGLYEFQNLIQNEPDLMNIGKGPYYPLYCVFMTNDGGKDPKSCKFYGLAGFSINFFTSKNKVLKDFDKSQLKKMNKCLHIILWQTDPEYAKLVLAKRYLEILEKAMKEAHKTAISIKKPKNEKQIQVYKDLGFVEMDDIKNYLVKVYKDENS